MTEDNTLATTYCEPAEMAVVPLSDTEIVRFEDPQFPWNITLDFDQDKLPKGLKDELHRLNNTTAYLLTQLHANGVAKQKWGDKFTNWLQSSTKYGPEDLLRGEAWERYYAAVVLSDEPLLGDDLAKALATATERDPLEQKILATELLTDKVAKAKAGELKKRASKLLCSRNPKDIGFFSDETLQECLEQQKLTTNKAINRALGRDLNTYIKATDRREALWAAWQERDRVLIKEHRLQTGDWGDEELEIKRAFTCYVWTQITSYMATREWCPDLGANANQTEVGLWSVVKQAYEEYDIDDYLLDPRDEDTWVGIHNFAQALKSKSDEYEQWYKDYQNSVHSAQRWMKVEGLKNLYGGLADWWAEEPDMSPKDGDELMHWVGHILRTEMYGEFRELVFDKYYKKLLDKLTNA